MTWALLLLSVLNARLTPEAAAAFDHYVQQAEARMAAGTSVRADREPHIEQMEAARKVDAPGAMIQDWVGTMFLPGATLDRVQAVLRDYSHYKDFYAPRVTESRELSHKGDDYDVFLRLYEKHVLTVVLNTAYRVYYEMPDARHLLVTSRSTHVGEVKDAGKSLTDEAPQGDDSGYLWRLNSYWRFEAADGGVYARCEAISLSRNVPAGLGWMLRGFLDSFPKESMKNTLDGTKTAVENHRVN
ncbi:MAG TPA: hypothetical protein VFW44_22385 [Bryobacteraceae bacterium]|nr:hypothetical protein [Bryobacteraceae bacterium]